MGGAKRAVGAGAAAGGGTEHSVSPMTRRIRIGDESGKGHAQLDVDEDDMSLFNKMLRSEERDVIEIGRQIQRGEIHGLLDLVERHIKFVQNHLRNMLESIEVKDVIDLFRNRIEKLNSLLLSFKMFLTQPPPPPS